MRLQPTKLLVPCLFLLLSAASASQQFSFYSSQRGKTYTVTTQAAGVALTFGGHWLYEPSVITPSTLTGGNYVLLFNSNRLAQHGGSDQAIFMSTSSNGYSGFSAPLAILQNSGTNLCDMIDARPIWDGQLWHVYVQAAEYTSGTSGSCSYNVGPGANAIYEARGASLTSLAWEYSSYPYVKRIIQINPDPSHDSQTGAAIGEGFQWFNAANYGGIPYAPILVVYNDWNWLGGPGGTMFAGVFNATETFGAYWYYNESVAYDPALGAYYPDVMLAGAANWASAGIPSFTMTSKCISGKAQYGYMAGVAFYPDPNPYPNFVVEAGSTVNGPVDSVSSDSNGPRGTSPKFARNEYGYIPTISNSPNTWQTYIYYNDAQVNQNGSDSCSGYSNWTSSGQRFSATKVTITEN